MHGSTLLLSHFLNSSQGYHGEDHCQQGYASSWCYFMFGIQLLRFVLQRITHALSTCDECCEHADCEKHLSHCLKNDVVNVVEII
jgi:hypothetical protein